MNCCSHTVGLLRFMTAGSVDDGKSTLIGRLLYDSGGVYEDQLQSIRKTTPAGNESLDLSLITDGLRAEREQAITIDVAYRYFSTRKRKFIIADAPGHEQYTGNMVTAASNASAAVILLDARKGVLKQTRRHAYIAWLLGIRSMILAVNKMDLVNFDRAVYFEICESFRQFVSSMKGLQNCSVPISALRGGNVVHRDPNMPWYDGPTILEVLEALSVEVEEDAKGTGFRFPVQSVVRPNQDFRGYAGQIVSGTAKSGQEVLALPSRQQNRIAHIWIHQKELEEAGPHQSVVVSLEREIDLSRGDMLVDPNDQPYRSQKVVANLIWMSPSPLRRGAPYLVKHTTQTLCGSIVRIFEKVEFDHFKTVETTALELNEIGKVELETHKPMFCEPYSLSRALGSFILIDPTNDATVAGGTIMEVSPSKVEVAFPYSPSFSRQTEHRAPGLTVWFTGLSGAGKTTISSAAYTELLARGIRVEVLDGDVIRKHLSSDLGFTKKDRDENIRRIGFIAQLLTRNGVVVLVSAISPYRETRDEMRHNIENFIEVHVNAPLEVCENRDPKGLYKKVRAGEICGFTGIDDPYECPLSPEVRCDTHEESVKSSTDKVIQAILTRFHQ